MRLDDGEGGIAVVVVVVMMARRPGECAERGLLLYLDEAVSLRSSELSIRLHSFCLLLWNAAGIEVTSGQLGGPSPNAAVLRTVGMRAPEQLSKNGVILAVKIT